MEQKPKIHPAVAALIVVVLVGIVATAVIVIKNDKDDGISSVNSTSSSNTASSDTVTTDTTDTATYKDGTYSATGTYISPDGRESLDLSVTIKDGVITDTSMVNGANSRESNQYQNLFASNYKTLIVGKKIAGLSLSRVAGSSLTSSGFNDAIDEIRNEAKV